MPIYHPTVAIYTLGCKVNQYESEAIAEAFEKNGFSVRPPHTVCDVYVINTCTVTAESDRKARQFIRRAIHKNPRAFILVAGCYSQANPLQIAAIAGVDYITGNANKLSVVEEAIRLIALGKKRDTPVINNPPPDAYGFEKMSITHFDRTRAYVKIEDGCENHCTYCIIPSARGKIRSKAPEDVLQEVRELTENGCREIVLTGIETASFGKDLCEYTLCDLLEEIDRIPNVGRIRLGSLDPSLMKAPFVERISHLSSLAPHFHLSMQSGSDKILALMKRKYNRRMALEAMVRLRQAIPNVQFTTDVIVGFPNETDEDFEDTKRFAMEASFLMIHVFPYSKRQGTPAATMEGQIPEEIKHQRVRELSALQARIRKEILDKEFGKTVNVLFETYRNGIATGHTPNFIEVSVPAPHPLHGLTLSVCIDGNDGEKCTGSLCKSTDATSQER
ncbi:MAG: tRNA (N(6)-L-threonylcarbamoyladenosine(37)-C(2))-methylthiotransferase MtaB [Clostridia bacterium]|nr:tRNA (N(6)-L-threonylcarbamoyladenosine(37)-C(2))-methylthiotransferase MtaB [Clostridia bacterium]